MPPVSWPGVPGWRIFPAHLPSERITTCPPPSRNWPPQQRQRDTTTVAASRTLGAVTPTSVFSLDTSPRQDIGWIYIPPGASATGCEAAFGQLQLFGFVPKMRDEVESSSVLKSPDRGGICKPRAKPWVEGRQKNQSPEGAKYESAARIYSALSGLRRVCRSVPRALPWAFL